MNGPTVGPNRVRILIQVEGMEAMTIIGTSEVYVTAVRDTPDGPECDMQIESAAAAFRAIAHELDLAGATARAKELPA